MAGRVLLFLVAIAALATVVAANRSPPAPWNDTILAVGSFGQQPNNGAPNATYDCRGKATLVVPLRGDATIYVNFTGTLTQVTRSHIHWLNLLNDTASFTINTLPLADSVQDLNPPISAKGFFSYIAGFPVYKLAEWRANMGAGVLFVNFKTVAIPQGYCWAPLLCKSGCGLLRV